MGGKRWTKEEEKIMSAHYETSPTIEEVAQMLGRPVCGVFKKGAAMGLRRPDLHDAAIERLMKAIDDTPRSSAEIAQRMGMARNSVSGLLRRGHKEGLCYIAGFKKNGGGRGMESPLWVVGAEENETNDRAAEIAERAAKRAAHAAVPFKPFRDPLVEAFFGRAAA